MTIRQKTPLGKAMAKLDQLMRLLDRYGPLDQDKARNLAYEAKEQLRKVELK